MQAKCKFEDTVQAEWECSGRETQLAWNLKHCCVYHWLVLVYVCVFVHRMSYVFVMEPETSMILLPSPQQPQQPQHPGAPALIVPGRSEWAGKTHVVQLRKGGGAIAGDSRGGGLRVSIADLGSQPLSNVAHHRERGPRTLA